MDLEQFWQLQEQTKVESDNNGERQAELLVAALVALGRRDIVDYRNLHRELHDAAYLGDLWTAASTIDCGCGNDGFMDFRSWLIGQGKQIYERALANPDSLADAVPLGAYTQVEPLLYVAYKAYRLLTGNDLDVDRIGEPPDLVGQPTENEEEQARIVPKLYAKFGDCASFNRALEDSSRGA